MTCEERWMPQKRPRVKLQKLLRDAFAGLPEEIGGSCSRKASRPVNVPTVRTSEDRSRMLRKVSEELARRAAPKPSPAQPTACEPLRYLQGSLFGYFSGREDARGSRGFGKSFATAAMARRSVMTDIRWVVAEAYRSMFRVAPED